MNLTSRFIIGIDLGTTQSCVYMLDTEAKSPSLQPFMISQISSGAVLEKHALLSSAIFLSPSSEREDYGWKLPWDNISRTYCVGAYAESLGAQRPDRYVSSFKSWLCHSRLHRKDPVLPIHADPNIDKISPLKATSRVLEHIRMAWNQEYAKKHPELALEEQQITITIPASFDEVSRKLTMEAAKLAGFKHFSFLEEPQAAFYAELSSKKKLEEQFKKGEHILVVDVGGGTCDFSYIGVGEKEKGLVLERLFVGEHLLLGGDNIDALVEHKMLQALSVDQLSLSQKQYVRTLARQVKENLFKGETSYNLVLEGKGSSLVGGSISGSLDLLDLEREILEGFFALQPYSEAALLKRGASLQELGLPFVQEPSVIKQLAAFLQKNGVPHNYPAPDYILFNGGTLKPKVFQERIIKALETWFEKSLKVLPAQNLFQAVAKGACYYGLVQRGQGVKIEGGCPKAYYLVLEEKQDVFSALTLVPKDASDGYQYLSEKTFKTKTNTPLRFHLLSSVTRRGDLPGSLIDVEAEEVLSLPPLYTLLELGKGIDKEQKDLLVKLRVSLNSLGGLEILVEEVESGVKWALDFDLEGTSSSKKVLSETISNLSLSEPKSILSDAFLNRDPQAVINLVKKLEEQLELERAKWSPHLLRALWEALLSVHKRRTASLEFEKRWWQLSGFFLRPGVGYPMDEHRVKDLWRVYLQDVSKKSTQDVEIAKMICLRRVAHGLSKGQQLQIASLFLPEFMKRTELSKIYKKNYAFEEKLRLFASLERLDVSVKEHVGDFVVSCLEQGAKKEVYLWTLARLGARSLLYASLASLIPPDRVFKWLKRILPLPVGIDNKAFLIEYLTRKIEEKDFEISPIKIEELFKACLNEEERVKLGRCVGKSVIESQADMEKILGDELPLGLELVGN